MAAFGSYPRRVLVERERPIAQLTEAARLVLEPLPADHPAEMAPLLDDTDLHRSDGARTIE